MSLYKDEDVYGKFQMMQRVVNMFDGNPGMQRIIQYGLLAQMEDEDEDIEIVDNYDLEWDSSQNKYHINKKSCRKLSYTEFVDLDSCGLMEASASDFKESDAERKARLLLEEKKSKEKAERKRLKKQRQKERKRLEKEQQNPTQDKELKDITSQAGNKPYNDKSKEKKLSVKDMASGQDSESSDYISDESSNEENEELDLTSSFVTKAAQIAKRQLEQKQENKEKKKTPVKEEPKTPEKPNNEENPVEKKDIATSSPKMEDYIKISTQLAMMGNKFATTGDFSMAVKYFTDAIRYNPTEYKLFGNRAFCFEKMHEYEKSLNDTELSLSMCPGWVKGLFRKGRALAGLKRYEEAASAFKEVLKLDSSCSEAVQELMRVQITQLMEYGFTKDQSSNALIIHGTVDKAREVLSKLNKQPEARPAPVPLQQVANVTGVSPVLSAKATPAVPPLHLAQDTSKTIPENKPLVPVQNQQGQAKPDCTVASKSSNAVQAPELFPVWVGNLSFSVTETLLTNLFNKVGTIYSMKHLAAKRCAFINFTQQQHCDDAIRKFHGFELMGSKLAVRYPDRIPPGMNISKSAHKADDLQDENLRHNLYVAGRTGGGRPIHPNYRGPYKY